MKAKMIAVAVAGMLVGCGSGGGSVEFQSQKGEPEVLEVLPEFKIESAKGEGLVQEQKPEFQYQDALKPAVHDVPPEADVTRYGLVDEKPEFTGAVHGEGQVGGFGELLITQHGEGAVNEVTEGGESKGQPLVQEENPEFHQENGDPAFESIEELAICQREGLQDQETCQAALAFINTGMSEARGEFDKDPAAFQIQANGAVATAEGGIKRATKRDATYPEVIEYLVNSVAEDETMVSRYTAAGYAIATYYYVRGIPEGHTKTGNPGLCADKGFCGDEYLKYQWN